MTQLLNYRKSNLRDPSTEHASTKCVHHTTTRTDARMIVDDLMCSISAISFESSGDASDVTWDLWMSAMLSYCFTWSKSIWESRPKLQGERSDNIERPSFLLKDNVLERDIPWLTCKAPVGLYGISDGLVNPSSLFREVSSVVSFALELLYLSIHVPSQHRISRLGWSGWLWSAISDMTRSQCVSRKRK